MTYRPKTVGTIWMHDRILAVLREFGPLNTKQLSEKIGAVGQWKIYGKDGPQPRPCGSQDTQPTLTSMMKHGEVIRDRSDSGAIWTWMLGPNAPEPVDMSALEQLVE